MSGDLPQQVSATVILSHMSLLPSLGRVAIDRSDDVRKWDDLRRSKIFHIHVAAARAHEGQHLRESSE